MFGFARNLSRIREWETTVLRLLGNEARHLARRTSQRQPEAPPTRVRRSVEVRAPLTKKGPSLGALERLYRVSRSCWYLTIAPTYDSHKRNNCLSHGLKFILRPLSSTGTKYVKGKSKTVTNGIIIQTIFFVSSFNPRNERIYNTSVSTNVDKIYLSVYLFLAILPISGISTIVD